MAQPHREQVVSFTRSVIIASMDCPLLLAMFYTVAGLLAINNCMIPDGLQTKKSRLLLSAVSCAFLRGI